MTPKHFDRLAKELFGPALAPFGFSSAGSKFCTFHRKVSNEVYHIICPDPGKRGAWYDVKVFPTSPILEPSFDSRFPDGLGIPTDVWSYLSEQGVGLDQQQFNCKYEENLRLRFEITVQPLLLTTAIPYLDAIQTIQDMLPLIRHSSCLGLAMHHVGRIEEAKVLLRTERERLSQADTSDKRVAELLDRIDQLLKQ